VHEFGSCNPNRTRSLARVDNSNRLKSYGN
jgi:hypothetical protein